MRFVLQRLESVPWGELSHAFGNAGDVPGLLRALTSKDAVQREDALFELFGNIWHQGTVYEATAYAVPFLVELAVDRTISGRAEILGLIGWIAASDDGPRAAHFEVLRRCWVLAELLADPVSLVRAGAAYALGFLREQSATLSPRIRAAIEAETDDLTRAGMFLGLASLRDSEKQNVTWLEHRIAVAADDRERFVAAVALAQSARADTPDVAIAILASACVNADKGSWFVDLRWNVAPETLPRYALVAVGATARAALPIILEALGTAKDEVHASFLLEDALAIVFGQDSLDQRPSRLDVAQRSVLAAVLSSSIVWQNPDLFSGALDFYALPSTRDRLNDFVEHV